MNDESGDPHQEYQDLLVIVPRELSKIGEQLEALNKEKEKLKDLSQMLGDSDFVSQYKGDKGSSKVWSVITDYQATIEQQKSDFRSRLRQVETKLSALKDS